MKTDIPLAMLYRLFGNTIKKYLPKPKPKNTKPKVGQRNP